jgi:NCAIR mutase (PurE)-related protein
MATGLPDESTLRELLGAVYSGSGQLERALAGLRSLGLQQGAVGSEMGDCDLDLLREDRCGFPEVVYGPGKPAELVVRILQRQAEFGQDSLVTRVSVEQREAVLSGIPWRERSASVEAAGVIGTVEGFWWYRRAAVTFR